MENEVIKAIKERRSVRQFLKREVPDDLVREVLTAGSWAPSGLNNQPWRFIVVRDEKTKEAMAQHTHYGHTIRGAPVLICVFMDAEASYDRTKDSMGIGACNQNILLAAHSLGLGTVWLGEILKDKEDVRKILGAPDVYELMAVICLGYPEPRDRGSERKPVEELAFRERYGEKF
jgi:nitroreductase